MITYTFYFSSGMEPHDVMFMPKMGPSVRRAIIACVLQEGVVGMEFTETDFRITVAGPEIDRIQAIQDDRGRYSNIRHEHARWRDLIQRAAERFVVSCAPGEVRDAVGFFRDWEVLNQKHMETLGEERRKLERALYQIARGETYEKVAITADVAKQVATAALESIGVKVP